MTVHAATERAAILRGILLFQGAMFAGATMDVFIKLMAAGYPTGQIVFFRSAFGVLPIVLVLVPRGGWRSLWPASWGPCVARGVVQTGAAFFFFMSFSYMPLAEAYAIGFTAPLWVAILSQPVLGERVTPVRLVAIVLGFTGILVMLSPELLAAPGQGAATGGGWLGPTAAMLGAFFYALAAVLIRRLGRSETTGALAFSASLTMALATLPTALFGWVMPSGPDLMVLILIGLLGGFMTILFTEAFRTAPASAISPFEYTAMIWGVGFGYLVFGDVPTPMLFVGAAIVIASGLWLLRAESRPA